MEWLLQCQIPFSLDEEPINPSFLESQGEVTQDLYVLESCSHKVALRNWRVIKYRLMSLLGSWFVHVQGLDNQTTYFSNRSPSLYGI